MLIQQKSKWQQILLNQRIANAKQWIHKLKEAVDPADLVNREYENILRALEFTLSLADQIELSFSLIQILHPIVVDFADWNRWLIYLNQLLTHLPPSEIFKRATLQVQIGDVKGRMGNLGEAEQAYQAGITSFKQGNHKNKQAFSMGRLAIVYAQKGELTDAIKLCQSARRLAEETNDRVTLSQIQLNLSFIYFHKQEFSASLAAADLAYKNFLQLDMQKDATKALLNIVASSNEMGNWEEVELQARALIHKVDASGDITTLSQLKKTLGVAAFNQGKYQAAESSWHEALLLHTQMNDSSEVAGIYNNLGMVYTKLKEWEASRGMFEKAIEAYDELGDTYYKANAQDNLADLFFELGDIAGGCNLLQAALDELEAIQPTPHVLDLITHIREKLRLFS